jgi:predicted chitinase
MFYTGVVESRSDPLELGRCQVRIVGLHTHDKTQLPTQQLPWATPVQPIGSAAMNGIGYTPVGPVEGTTVIIMFADDVMQQPIMLGTVGGIPSAPAAISDDDSANPIQSYNIKNIELRTIEGPVTGKQLTFIDKETGKTNLTAGLTANMKVLGFGLSKECYIVSIDSPTQITISELVTGYGENIITFKPAATNLAEVNASKASTVLTDGSGNPVVSGDGTPIQSTPAQPSATTPATPTATSTNTSIPTVPPPKSTPNSGKASDGIKALIAACDKVGLTTKEQKCALLGIAGGESGWIPQLEGFSYSESRLKQIYSFTTAETAAKYSDAPKKGITREQFFSWVYGPTQRGKGFLGNQTDADGGKYYGRGFIQLTGKGNYARYQKLANAAGLNIDIVNNPDSLDTDINVSAMVAALYIKDRVPAGVKPNAHPDYFYAAKKAVGVNSPDIAARKLKYYEYFYGNGAGGAVEKDASPPAVEPPKDGSSPTPGPSEASIANGTDNTGFRDPNNKYPLKDYIGEPDTNRLARGLVEGTIVEKKDASIRKGVPKANGQGSWDQHLPSYGAQYPYNKVYESEAGHIQEFDDTPGYERIHTYHRAGTYHEVDPMGTQTNYIVGDNFMITERNGFIWIGGEYNLTVDGNANIFCRTDANIEVAQNATIKVGNNLDVGVANDVTLAVGGNMQLKAVGQLDIAADNITMKSSNNFFVQAGQGTSIKSNAIEIESAQDMNILAGGNLNADYSQGNFGNGASGAQDVEDFTLTPPDAGDPLNPTVPQLIPPDRRVAEGASAETPQDYSTPEGRAESAKQSRDSGVPNPAPAVVSETPTTPGGGTNTVIPTDCKIIYNTTNFTDDYRMSKNFTLGMLMAGGLNGQHKLVDQQLTGDDGKIRTYTVQEIVCNLAQTAQNILEPALEVLPGGIGGRGKLWMITSGYRLKGVIKTESPNSSHCKGFAIDVALLSKSLRETYELAQKLEKVIPYDQCILEYRYQGQVWVHLGYGKTQRKQAFTMLNDKSYQGTFPKGGFVLVDSITPPAAVVK